jgi:hypothetical protein
MTICRRMIWLHPYSPLPAKTGKSYPEKGEPAREEIEPNKTTSKKHKPLSMYSFSEVLERKQFLLILYSSSVLGKPDVLF